VGELLQTDEFRQVFKEWMSKVREHRVNPAEVDWERINIDEFLKQLKKIKLTHLFGLIAALLGVLATVATLAFKAGQALRLPPAGS
jgi:hypothetical protein